MSNEITSSSLLISMLVELRQENRQLASELTNVRLLLQALQAGTGSAPTTGEAKETAEDGVDVASREPDSSVD